MGYTLEGGVLSMHGLECPVTAEAEIEAALGHWGFEQQEDFSGPFVQEFVEDEDGDINEGVVWAAVYGWLQSLTD